MPSEGVVTDVNTPTPVDNSIPEPTPTTEGTQTPVVEPFDYAHATRDQRRAKLESFFTPEPVPQTTPPVTKPAIPPVTPPEPNVNVPPSVEPSQDIPEKFKNPDGSLNTEALLKSYVAEQSKIGEQGNRIGDYSRQIQELTAKIQQLEQSPQPAPTTGEPTGDNLRPPEEFDSEEWFDRFYVDPKAALQQLFSEAMQQTVKPLEPVIQHFQQEQERSFWREEVAKAQDKYSDFEEYRGRAAEILREQPELLNLPNAIEACYKMAKAEVLGTKVASQPTLEDMLKDPNFVSQLSQNPEIQKQVMRTYSERVSAQPKPTVMGQQAGGVPSFTPPPEIKTVKDATRAFKDMLMRGAGG